jgi:nitrous oxidase accessory protein
MLTERKVPSGWLVVSGLALLLMVTTWLGGRSVDRQGEDARTPVVLAGIGGGDASNIAVTPLAGREIVVGQGGDAATISDALSMADDGDRIRVLPGLYTDTPIVVDKSVELIGDDFPVLDGEYREGIVLITAPGVTVHGFVLRNSGVSHVRDHAALRIENTSDCKIQNNRFEDNFFGIYLAKAHGCSVVGNSLRASGTREASSGNGIHLWDVREAVIDGNDIEGHRDGIYLEFAEGAIIRGNTASNNLRYGLHFMFSDDSAYENNVFSNNGAGVAVMYSRRVTMVGNRFEQNWGTAAYGLLLKDFQDARIENNQFSYNTTAILADGADRLVFTGNRFERNGWAIKVQASSQDNLFTENDFVDNTFDVVTNSRRSYNTFDRNYWSRYTGYDLDGDGVGDVPFRPVRLFSFIVETRPIAVILLRSFFVDILDLAERVLPVLTPEMLVDDNPLLTEVTR